MEMAMPRAPEFPEGYTWLNTDRPLHLKQELRGHVVILDFWTYCCINCMHVIPDLQYLEHKYSNDPVAFIGVHSNKYTNEAVPENIREAVLRYGITHPVVVDQHHTIWDAYAVNAWPTLAVIDTSGQLVGLFSGEGHRDELDRLIAALLDIGHRNGTLAGGPLPVKPEQPHPERTGLSYPGKVLADPAGKRIFIADSGHNRVIMTDYNGEVLGFFGHGKRGLLDGGYEDARFNNPQGLLLLGGALYIADTDNHAIRRVDLVAYHVDTVLGNGMIGYDRHGGHRGRDQMLNSPWDLALLDGQIYLAMAGLHQIWRYDPVSEEAHVVIGTGRENIADNVARKSALAQTSGLSVANGKLYFADSETSSIRQFDPATDLVTTLVGKGLFTFGYEDGSLAAALMQHPLGVAAQDGILYVADTYNHAIRTIDMQNGEVRTLIGALGERKEPELYEPGGLSVAGRDLFIADTNHDRVIQYQLDSGKWRELQLTIEGHPVTRVE